MELRQLRYFVTVAKLRNFSEASRQLNITQSTLSHQIIQLEGELGVELLVRDTHHVRLTDIGAAFLPQAEKTLSTAGSCIDRIRDVQKLDTGELNLGSTYTFLPLLKETVLMYMQKYPGVKLNICCHSMETLLNMLRQERIDMALSYKPATIDPEIDSHILFDNQLAVVVSDTHPLAKSESVRLSDLEKFPMALPAKGLQARNTFDRLIEGAGYQLNVRLEINEVNVLVDLVRLSGRLVSVLSEAALAQTSGIKVLKLNHPDTQMEGSFHVLKNGYMKRTTREFLRMLCENRSYGLALMNLL